MYKKYVLVGLIITSLLLVGCGDKTDVKDTNVVQNENKQNVVEPIDEDEEDENNEEEEKPKEDIKEVPVEPTENLDNTRVGWSFGFVEDKTVELCEKYNAIYASKNQDKSLYLTFDEGYENGYTGQILDTLKEENVPAAFFITGPYLESEQDLVKRMIAEGHIVGNHTWDHPSMPEWNNEKLTADITKLSDAFTSLSGQQMKFLRPPKGDFSERTLELIQRLGYTTVFWKFAYADWDPNNQKGTEYAYTTVTNKVKDGDIILLHAVSKDNANALGDIIKYFKEQGYTFKSLNDFN